MNSKLTIAAETQLTRSKYRIFCNADHQYVCASDDLLAQPAANKCRNQDTTPSVLWPTKAMWHSCRLNTETVRRRRKQRRRTRLLSQRLYQLWLKKHYYFGGQLNDILHTLFDTTHAHRDTKWTLSVCLLLFVHAPMYDQRQDGFISDIIYHPLMC